jgi:acetate kinase
MLLAVNAGSSSLKVSVFDEVQLDKPTISVAIEGIATLDACLIPDGAYGGARTIKLTIPDHQAAATAIMWWLKARGVDILQVKSVGHRVVHGGERYDQAAVIDSEVIEYIRSITPLAPNHMPVALTCIDAFKGRYRNATHIACFDTAFFHDIPEVAQTIAVPETIRNLGVRRYGFHGLSYEYILKDFMEHEGEAAANGRVIIAHLGSGASLTAIKDGLPIDMTMGFTPASGIVMSTRTGDIDPGLIDFLLRERSMTPQEVSDLISKQSGLLGISGTTADMHKLLMDRSHDEYAALAIDIFCYNIKKTIGSYAAALGGVDSIIFSAGIGERSAAIRQQVVSGLDFLGAVVDDTRNERGDRLISAEHSRVGIHIIPTHEDVIIAQKTLQLHQEKQS